MALLLPAIIQAIPLCRPARLPTLFHRYCPLVLLTLSALLILRYVSRPEPSSYRGLLVSTPSNTSYPFNYVSLPSLIATPLTVTLPHEHFPTHLLPHPTRRDVYFVTDEVGDGEVWAVRLEGGEPKRGRRADHEMRLVVEKRVKSGGRAPAFCAVQGGRGEERLICSNYDSPTISIHRILHYQPYLQSEIVHTLLPPSPSQNPELISHPHQIIPHPIHRDLIYVPDIGLNVVHVLSFDPARAGETGEVRVLQQWSGKGIGEGARHGVVSPDGQMLFLSFQTSSSVASILLDPSGLILDPQTSTSSTLPPGLHPSPTFALSDIHLLSRMVLLILNRRVLPPYPPSAHPTSIGGDTLALLRFVPTELLLKVEGHVELGCWQPREAVPLLAGSSGGGQVGISCVGMEGGATAGVVVLNAEKRRVDGRWDSGGVSVWGMVGVV